MSSLAPAPAPPLNVLMVSASPACAAFRSSSIEGAESTPLMHHPASGAADHVEVDHRHRLFQGNRRVAHVIGRSQQPHFLSAERDEHETPRKAAAVGRGRFRHLDDGRGSGCVVVGAVVNLSGGARGKENRALRPR